MDKIKLTDINIYKIGMTKKEYPELPYLSNSKRLEAYQTIIDGCSHLWSKGKMQEEKVLKALIPLIKLGKNDPYFLSHFVSWIITTKHPSKDLQVLTTYANSLSTADGRPFRAGSKYNKPNLRYISAAALCQMSPKLVLRVRRLGQIKFEVKDLLNKGSHWPNSLTTAIKKYLKYREANIEIMKGVKKAGLSNTVQNLYRSIHLSPSDEVANILRWQQKDKKIKFAKPLFDFKNKSDLEIAEAIRKDKLPVLGVIGALPHISPVIAVALLEQATGNQAVILRKTFEDSGVLKDKEIMKLYSEKIKEAKTSIDRVETISKTASTEVKKVLKKARAEVRKQEMVDIGKVYLHVDFSPSMEGAIKLAKERGAIIAECVNNPKENFRWGRFFERGEELPIPKTFEKDAFEAILFGKRLGGGTDCFALYPRAREFGAEVDIFISDGEHNCGDLENKIKRYHEQNPSTPKPKAVVLVRVKGNGPSAGDPESIRKAYESIGVPYAEMKPETLVGSAMVASSIRSAILGPMEMINQITECPLLELPNWYLSI